MRNHTAQFRDVGTDFDVELAEQFLAHSPTGDPSHGLAGAGALQNVAGIQAVVLEGAGEIGVTRPRPCDSPAVVNRKVMLPLCYGRSMLRPCSLLYNSRARPRSGSPLQVPDAGRRQRGGTGSGFVIGGNCRTRSPVAVTPNSSWFPPTSRATRSGPTIGSRTGIDPRKSPKYVSNTSMLPFGFAENIRRWFLSVPPPQYVLPGGHCPVGAKSWK